MSFGRITALIIGLLVVFGQPAPATAQEQVWIQIEARPTLEQGEERLQSYSGFVGPLNGYRLRSGWYAIALGPFSPDAAQGELLRLLSLGQIPRDSFIADGSNFRERFGPAGTTSQFAVTPPPQQTLEEAAPVATLEVQPEETVRQSRDAERLLTRTEREDIQRALQWEGFYTSTIDGAFGPGTRRAMESYQLARGLRPTGVLSTRQRQELISEYRSVLASLGMETFSDPAAGVSLSIPGARVTFDRYEPPFVHFDPVEDDSGYKVLMISQDGDRSTLAGLFELMQTLEIVPLDGFREAKRDSFVLTGQSRDLHSYTFAQHKDGAIKGFTVAWPPKDDRVMSRVVDMMQSSFVFEGDKTLDPSLGQTTEEQSIDLLAGLEVRKPVRSRAGFFLNSGGAVLTTVEAVDQCTRVTLDGGVEAQISLRDDSFGIATLSPVDPLSPRATAALAQTPARLQSDVAVSGFPYEGVLGAPSLTYGTLADLRGLAGEDHLTRLAVQAAPGDAGGPVLDGSGRVLGILLPKEDASGRQLPEDVQFAMSATALAETLAAGGIDVAQRDEAASLPAERLASLAADMTVLVSCWR